MERENTEDTVIVESIEGKAIDGEIEHGGYRSCGVNKRLSYRWIYIGYLLDIDRLRAVLI